MPIYQVWACRRPSTHPENTIVSQFNRPPMVSVIVPTYNRPDRLREALESILAQTFQDFEVIVVNDGEMDVASVVDALPHGGRITCVKHDHNRGLAAARNTGNVCPRNYVSISTTTTDIIPTISLSWSRRSRAAPLKRPIPTPFVPWKRMTAIGEL